MNKKIVLASGSPRRKELLEMAGIPFDILIPEVDEAPLPRETPQNMVKRLALMKALAAARGLSGDTVSSLILSADTTVVDPSGRNLGKPRNVAEARKMVTALAGKDHFVFTGYSLVEMRKGVVQRILSRRVRTRVRIREMTAREIRDYVGRGESLDKAGAYAAQGFGMALIEQISGSYTNVVGLPITEVTRDLRLFGWRG
jgi:septum formation protein